MCPHISPEVTSTPSKECEVYESLFSPLQRKNKERKGKYCLPLSFFVGVDSSLGCHSFHLPTPISLLFYFASIFLSPGRNHLWPALYFCRQDRKSVV